MEANTKAVLSRFPFLVAACFHFIQKEEAKATWDNEFGRGNQTATDAAMHSTAR